MRTTYQCDLVAIMLHRGTEYRMTPSTAQTQLAHILVDSGGIDLIIGTHPHVPQTIEQYSGAYIFYSLGNALFDQDRGRTSIGAGMSTILDYSRNTEKGTKTVPTYISIFPELSATKTTTGTTLSLITVHTYTITK
jgi:poly-gamma-glutamate capsule biosynthesis protein CapA/YwtB (metallophosphatase superfamily)